MTNVYARFASESGRAALESHASAVLSAIAEGEGEIIDVEYRVVC